ncbi:uncharacterized protein [Tursiops truncatus]|uniref:Formin-like protein 20 n=1 Tax=Tursiops truncatus TaxID=9739 RepID=A0A6J3QTL4_TURTR|nr:formin-like protein 20 [Tursiops truncatus]
MVKDLEQKTALGKGFPDSNIGFHFPSRAAAAARPRRRGEPCEARAPRPAPPEAGPELCGKLGRAVPPLGGATSPAPPLLRGRGETRQRRLGFPPAPQPPPRSLERRHVAARPAPPSPPRTHGAAAVGPASSCLAGSRPARSRPAGRPAIPMGTAPRSGLARAGPQRPGLPPGPGRRPCCGERPWWAASEPGRSCSGRGPGSLHVPLPGRGGLQDCKLQQVVEDAALAESAGKTPALGAPHPTQPAPHRVITVITPLYSPRDCECLEGSFCVSPGGNFIYTKMYLILY